MFDKSKLRLTAKRWSFLTGSVFAALLVVGCANKHDLLNTFFDVPPPKKATTISNQPKSTPTAGQSSTLTVATLQELPRGGIHPPFRDGKCASCHQSNSSQSLKTDRKGTCFACHKDFLATTKCKHAPAQWGDCLTCHSPHTSTEPHLMRKDIQVLCLECHKKRQVARVAAHANIGDAQCATCHNAHGEDNPFLLKPAAKHPATTQPSPQSSLTPPPP